MIANPIPWPDGARCAVAMTWDMDADSAFNWYNRETADNLVAAQSWTRYDPLIAIRRLVEQFRRRELGMTFFVPGWVIEKYPAQIDLLLANGHEIGLHGYLHERSNEISQDAAWEFGALWISVWHPALSGRLARFKAALELLDDMRAKGGVWFARLDEICDHVQYVIAERHWALRTETLPIYESPLPEFAKHK